MAKTKISEYSATAANNTDVESVNIAEGCAPSGINNAIREVMSHLKDFQVGSAGDSLTVGGNFSVTGTVTIPDNAISGDKVEGGTINAITINTLTATNNPTLSAGTANGVTYLNGSKVLTSGSALTTNGSSLGVGSSDFGGAGSINVSVGVAGTTTGGLQLWSTTTGQHYVQFGDGTAGAATYAGAIGYSHATDQMSFYASATEQMRLTSTGLGIGTSSPPSYGSTFTVVQASNSGSGVVQAHNSTNSVITEIESEGTRGAVGTRTNHDLAFKTNQTVRMRLDSSGNLGLGVTPSATGGVFKALQVGNGSAIIGQTNDSSVVHVAGNTYFDNSNVSRYIASTAAQRYRGFGGGHEWYSAPSGTAGDAISFTQAMTLTAAGDLLVGKTSSSFSVAGIGLMGSGNQIWATATSDNSLALNRLSTDGDIAKFYKDGATVGSIGVNGANSYIGTGDTGLHFAADLDVLNPWNPSTNGVRDNAINLGWSAGRFKDLYLSGGVYLGGTVAANHLDDYEEGTWNIIVDYSGSTSGVTYNHRNGYYTKIGNVVTVQGEFQLSSKGTGSGVVRISLPLQNISARGGLAVGNTQSITVNNESREFLIEGGSSFFYIRYPSGAGSTTDMTYADISSSFYVVFAGTYMTA
jgi:hypothetical protein